MLQVVAKNGQISYGSELGRRRVEQNRSSNERESVGEKAGRSCLALTWATTTEDSVNHCIAGRSTLEEGLTVEVDGLKILSDCRVFLFSD